MPPQRWCQTEIEQDTAADQAACTEAGGGGTRAYHRHKYLQSREVDGGDVPELLAAATVGLQLVQLLRSELQQMVRNPHLGCKGFHAYRIKGGVVKVGKVGMAGDEGRGGGAEVFAKHSCAWGGEGGACVCTSNMRPQTHKRPHGCTGGGGRTSFSTAEPLTKREPWPVGPVAVTWIHQIFRSP
jgi:hypothetical protein